MSIASLLHRVTSCQKTREPKRRTDYHEMVRQIAEGKGMPKGVTTSVFLDYQLSNCRANRFLKV